jgi:hypothetical protein
VREDVCLWEEAQREVALVVLNFSTAVQSVVETEGMRLLVSSYAESFV